MRCQDTRQGCNYKKKKGKANSRDSDDLSEELLAEVRGMHTEIKEGLDRIATSLGAVAGVGVNWWNREAARERVGIILSPQPDRSPMVVTERMVPVEKLVEDASGGEETQEEEMAVDCIAGPSRLA